MLDGLVLAHGEGDSGWVLFLLAVIIVDNIYIYIENC